MELLRSISLSGNTTAPNASTCCLALSTLFGPLVSFPGTPTYQASLDSYFTQQNAHLQPYCILTPTSPEEISTALTTLTSIPNCPIAIRSGGHAYTPGASNIASGITLSLQNLNSITVSSDHTIASIGAGATWGEVYAHLDPLNLSVSGGRAAQVGVGGLTTGGGISYFSPRYGWTCDSAVNFEVVLANGTIVNANEDENAELLFALRGGSNNFGVVTRVDMKAFEQGPVWGGSVYHDVSTVDEQVKAFVDLNSAEEYDEYASLITSFGFAGGKGAAVVNSLEYTRAEENPEVFRGFMEIPRVHSTMRIAGMHEIAVEQGSFSPDGNRQLGVVTTHGSTVSMLKAVYQRWNASLAAVQDVPGIVWSISLEPLPPAIYARGSSTNAMGLDDISGSLVVTLLSATWSDEVDDAKVEKAARELFENIEDDACKLDVYESFVYLNYAAPWQDPIASYKSKSIENLKRVSQDVDPKGVFRVNVPGGFKLPD
ncbi:hypothetical protein BDV23DRAFT_64619, partial [Aspergillus alliaceus]